MDWPHVEPTHELVLHLYLGHQSPTQGLDKIPLYVVVIPYLHGNFFLQHHTL
jgi:hypothetical protein